MQIKQIIQGLHSSDNLHAGLVLTAAIQSYRSYQAGRSDESICEVLADVALADYSEEYVKGFSQLDINWLIEGRPVQSSLRNLVTMLKRKATEGNVHSILPDVANQLSARLGADREQAKRIVKLASARLSTASLAMESVVEFSPYTLTWASKPHVFIKIK